MKRFFTVLGLIFVLLVFYGVSIAEEFFPPPGDGKGVVGGRAGQAWRLGIFDEVRTDRLTTAVGTNIIDSVALPLTTFSTNGTPMAFTSGPEAYMGEVTEATMEGDAGNPAIILRAGDGVTPFETTFLVRDNYLAGQTPYFTILASSSELSQGVMPSIDFRTKVHSATSIDETYVEYDPVILTSTPDEATLTVLTSGASPFETLAAGNWVTIQLNRLSPGTGDLNIYGIAFEYIKSY